MNSLSSKSDTKQQKIIKKKNRRQFNNETGWKIKVFYSNLTSTELQGRTSSCSFLWSRFQTPLTSSAGRPASPSLGGTRRSTRFFSPPLVRTAEQKSGSDLSPLPGKTLQSFLKVQLSKTKAHLAHYWWQRSASSRWVDQPHELYVSNYDSWEV